MVADVVGAGTGVEVIAIEEAGQSGKMKALIPSGLSC